RHPAARHARAIRKVPDPRAGPDGAGHAHRRANQLLHVWRLSPPGQSTLAIVGKAAPGARRQAPGRDKDGPALTGPGAWRLEPGARGAQRRAPLGADAGGLSALQRRRAAGAAVVLRGASAVGLVSPRDERAWVGCL